MKKTFKGQVYKLRHDKKGSRLTFIKTLSGRLQIKDEFVVEDTGDKHIEKVNEIRIYNGENMRARMKFLQALQSKINILDKTDVIICMEKLRILESEDPMLSVTYKEETEDILVSVMGKIQLEVLEQIVKDRFGILLGFKRPQVQYRETIASSVVGYGHFEPLRHYAEVQLRLEPFYNFEIYIEENYLGKVISDIQKLRGSYEPPVQVDGNVYIKGRGPVETFMEYGVQLASFTKGKGSITLLFDGYDVCENAEEAIERINYDKDRDVDNKSSSVFCAKGSSFTVPWNEAENYMHTID